MKRSTHPVFLALFLIISSCDNPAQQNQPPVYYDVAGFVQKQITDLAAARPPVRKGETIAQEPAQWQSTRDINWTRELDLFIQADINKPALRSSYQITRPDSLTYQYTLKPSEERLTVRSLTVQLDSTTRQPRRIEAVLQNKNPLYESERKLAMQLGMNRERRWRVQHYRVAGFQKLAFRGSTPFSVEGHIDAPSAAIGPQATAR